MKKIILLAALTLATAFAEPQQTIQILPATVPGLQPVVLIDNRPAPNAIIVTPAAPQEPMAPRPLGFASPQPSCGKFKF